MFRRSCLGALLLGALSPSLLAQTPVARPVRLVVPFPPGGGTDALARGFSEALARELGQPVIIDNKAGAGTAIGNDIVARSAPDGLTLLLNTNAIAILPSLQARLPYDTLKGFAPVTVLGRAPLVAVVPQDSPIRDGADLLARARATPGRLSYGSAGNGTSTHLGAELLKVNARIYLTHIPYRGASPMVTDLLGGQIDLAFATLPSVAGALAGGRLRALAVTSPRRSPQLPDVMTFAEAGVKGFAADVWYGVFAPAGTPAGVVARLHEALRRATDSPDFRRRAAGEGMALTLDRPDDATRTLHEEVAKWRQVVREQSIRLE